MKSVLGVLFIGVWLISCTPQPRAKLTIAAAANMQFAMDELTDAFTKSTLVECETIISSSGMLTAQIQEGAPFDIFISADIKYPVQLHDRGLTAGRPKIYAYGRLVLWSVLDLPIISVQGLVADDIDHIALANPRTAPYGWAALEVLKHYEIYELVKHKLVYGESISQTNQFIISKAADIGFTAKAVVLSPKMKGHGRWIEIDSSLYSPIGQAMVILKNRNDHVVEAQMFHDFMLSADGQKILENFGYRIPD